MKNRNIFTVFIMLIIFLLPMPLFSIGFGFHVFEVRAMPDFGNGFFPISVLYQFNFQLPELISGNDTVLAVSFDNGLDSRFLDQKPDDGSFFDENKYSADYFENREYLSLFDEFAVKFEQGFLGKTLGGEDHLMVHASFGGRFEKAFERLGWMSDSSNVSGVFWKSPDVLRYPDSSWKGQPELYGNRNIFNTFLNFGFFVDYLDSHPTVRNGISFGSMLRLSPNWVPFNDGSVDFYEFKNTLSLAYTPYVLRQKKNDNLSWCSIVLGSDFVNRTIWGNKVPYYSSHIDAYGIKGVVTANVLKNHTYITFFGPQFNAADLYCEFSIFHDLIWSMGAALNSDSDIFYNEISLSFGMSAKCTVYNIFSIYFDWGYVYKRPFETFELDSTKVRFGISVEV